MVDSGETATAWPLLEESLRTFRQLDLRRGEAQALGFLAEKPRGEGDLAHAIELRLESATIAQEIGWAWWESRQLQEAAALRAVRQWENRRKELEPLILVVDGPAFASARAEGHLLSVTEAAGLGRASAG